MFGVGGCKASRSVGHVTCLIPPINAVGMGVAFGLKCEAAGFFYSFLELLDEGVEVWFGCCRQLA